MTDEVLRVVLVDPAEDTRNHLRGVLNSEDRIWLEAECQRYDVVHELVSDNPPEAVIVVLDSDQDEAIALLESMARYHPQIKLVAVSSQQDGQFILTLMRTGVKEFVPLPLQAFELIEALDRIGGGAGGGSAKNAKCRLLAFMGARGGAGSTSLSVNTGTIIANEPGTKVAFIDLDLVLGDADLCLDITPDYTLLEVALSIDSDRVDLQFLSRALTKHSSGLSVLPHPIKMEDASVIKPEHLERVVNLLRRNFTHIIVDLSKSYLPTDQMALQLADEILFVIQLDMTSLNNTIRFLQSVEEKPSISDKIKVIANRVGSQEEIPLQRAEDTIGRKIYAQIPNDARTMFASRDRGIPLQQYAPRSKLFTAIQTMAVSLMRGDGGVYTPKGGGDKGNKKGGFGFFGSGQK